MNELQISEVIKLVMKSLPIVKLSAARNEGRGKPYLWVSRDWNPFSFLGICIGFA